MLGRKDIRKVWEREHTRQAGPRPSLAGPSSQQHLLLSISSVTDPMSREAPETGLSHPDLYGQALCGLQPRSDQLFPEI